MGQSLTETCMLATLYDYVLVIAMMRERKSTNVFCKFYVESIKNLSSVLFYIYFTVNRDFSNEDFMTLIATS